VKRTINKPRRFEHFVGATLLASALIVIAHPLRAQEANKRFRVLVVNFAPQGSARADFGKALSRQLQVDEYINIQELLIKRGR
jgi:hypothetical protein